MLSLVLLVIVKSFLQMITRRKINGENQKNKEITETKRRNKQNAAPTRLRKSVNKLENYSHKQNSARLIRDSL